MSYETLLTSNVILPPVRQEQQQQQQEEEIKLGSGKAWSWIPNSSLLTYNSHNPPQAAKIHLTRSGWTCSLPSWFPDGGVFNKMHPFPSQDVAYFLNHSSHIAHTEMHRYTHTPVVVVVLCTSWVVVIHCSAVLISSLQDGNQLTVHSITIKPLPTLR